MSCPRNIFGLPLHLWGKWEDDARIAVISEEAESFAEKHGLAQEKCATHIEIRQIRRCVLCNRAQLRLVKGG